MVRAPSTVDELKRSAANWAVARLTKHGELCRFGLL